MMMTTMMIIMKDPFAHSVPTVRQDPVCSNGLIMINSYLIQCYIEFGIDCVISLAPQHCDSCDECPCKKGDDSEHCEFCDVRKTNQNNAHTQFKNDLQCKKNNTALLHFKSIKHVLI